jgi:hypothetical protein
MDRPRPLELITALTVFVLTAAAAVVLWCWLGKRAGFPVAFFAMLEVKVWGKRLYDKAKGRVSG